MKADTEYTLAVAVATTGGSSPGSASVQFKTSEGGKETKNYPKVSFLQLAGTFHVGKIQ